MKTFVILILILFSTLSLPSRASESATTHFLAHAGSGYALTTVSYGVFHKGLGMGRTSSTILSLVLANAISIGREAYEADRRHKNLDWWDARNAAIGTGLSAMTIWAFDF